MTYIPPDFDEPGAHLGWMGIIILWLVAAAFAWVVTSGFRDWFHWVFAS
jgi:hypothetical protein